MGTNECSKLTSNSSWEGQDFSDVSMVLKSPPGHNELTFCGEWLSNGTWLELSTVWLIECASEVTLMNMAKTDQHQILMKYLNYVDMGYIVNEPQRCSSCWHFLSCLGFHPAFEIHVKFWE